MGKGIKYTLLNAFKYLQKKTINGLIHNYFLDINLKKRYINLTKTLHTPKNNYLNIKYTRNHSQSIELLNNNFTPI